MSSTSREAAEPPRNPVTADACRRRRRVAGAQNRPVGEAANERDIEAEAAPIGGYRSQAAPSAKVQSVTSTGKLLAPDRCIRGRKTATLARNSPFPGEKGERPSRARQQQPPGSCPEARKPRSRRTYSWPGAPQIRTSGPESISACRARLREVFRPCRAGRPHWPPGPSPGRTARDPRTPSSRALAQLTGISHDRWHDPSSPGDWSRQDSRGWSWSAARVYPHSAGPGGSDAAAAAAVTPRGPAMARDVRPGTPPRPASRMGSAWKPRPDP